METRPLRTRIITFYQKHGLISLLRKAVVKAVSAPISGPRPKRIISHSKLLTTVYFYIQGTFYQEQKKILQGQALHQINEEGRDNPKHRRIQYTHILEKGLSVPENKRRETFGDYVVRTLVNDLEVAWEKSLDPESDEQLKWSVDVLQKYFHTTGENKIILESKRDFNSFLNRIEYTPSSRTPQPKHEIEESSVTYEQLDALANQRSSTRYFLDKDVPRELLDDAVRIAAKSPSACNRQSFDFRIYDEREHFDDLLEHRVGTDSYAESIPVLVVLTGKQRAYKDDSERNTIFIDASLAAMSFQFALETLGLGACMINWPMHPKEQREIADQLDLDPDEQVINFIAVGYPDPDGKIPHSTKKDLTEIRSYNCRN